MKRYDSYKPSGVSWIAEVPSHWGILKLSQVSKEHYISNKEIHHQNLLSLSYGKIVRRDINATDGLLPASFDTYQIVEPGNVVMRLTDLQNDHKSLRVGFVKEEGIVTSAYLTLESRKSVNPKFLYLFLHTLDIHKYFYSIGSGIRQNLNFDGLRDISIIIPPLEEQEVIVVFLDSKTSKIDSYVAERERELDALKELRQAEVSRVVTQGLNPDVPMRDSGIPWLGKIPAHWKTEKINAHFKERRVKVSDKDYPALSVAKIGVVPQLDDAVKTDNGDNRKLVRNGDFVVNSRSDRKGSCGVASQDGSVSLINIVLEIIDMNKDYVHLLFRSNNYIEEFYRNGRGIVADLWTTRYSEMRNIIIPIPPIEEQQAIVDYINAKTAKIDGLIADLSAQIEKLKEYKQRLIADAVTGQIDVRK